MLEILGNLCFTNGLTNKKQNIGDYIMKKLLVTMGILLGLVVGAVSASAGTLQDVKKRGYLKCGVSTGSFGLSYVDDKGKYQGIDVEYCRALASAVFGSGKKVKFTPLTSKNRFTALQSGEIDVLSRGTTWTLSRDTDLGLDFVGVLWYDGQGFLVSKKLGIKSAAELNGASVCIQPGTTTEQNLAEYFSANKMKYKSVSSETQSHSIKSLQAGRCDVFTTDLTGVAGVQSSLANPKDWVVLPEVISKEPLGPSVRHGDSKWADIARWTLYTLYAAEEFGITSKNVRKMKKSKNKEVLRILGVEGELGKFLGLRKDFAYKIIKNVGNYKEVYERTMALTGLPRGQNVLWTQGGLLYNPPFR
jgi:general L-amino acid transport system substrate-binding protein